MAACCRQEVTSRCTGVGLRGILEKANVWSDPEALAFAKPSLPRPPSLPLLSRQAKHQHCIVRPLRWP